MQWTVKEQKLMEKYFKTSMREMTLFKKLTELNPKRTYEAMMRRIRSMKYDGWEKTQDMAQEKLRIGYLDIEATNLNADFGVILTWYIKTRGKNEYFFDCIKKSELFNHTFDKRVTESLLKAFEHYDVLYTHYGSDRRFDLPFIRTRAYVNCIEDMLPNYMEKFIMDTYPIARNKLKLHSNRLGSIAGMLGIDNVKKTPVTGDKWMKAMYGNEDALNYVLVHNKRDVQLLERVHRKLEKVEKATLRSM